MLYQLAKPFLFSLDAEAAHEQGLEALARAHRFGLTRCVAVSDQGRAVEVMGLNFPNPVGLAAGLDKNARYIDALATFGFGFIEVGTVTPRAQPGNPKPRMFRLPEHDAVINRLGFNNEGLEVFLRNVRARQWRGVLGINLGKNFDTPNERAVDDYLIGLRAVYPHADYITINISSPNTKNLRDLQNIESLKGLVGPLKHAQSELAQTHGKYVPLAVKLAPDMDEPTLRDTTSALVDLGADAIIATNTTLDRAAVSGHRYANETGGLSGAPVRERANVALETIVRASQGALPVIGVGGIQSLEDAQQKLSLGAKLVQVYTGLVFKGPGLVKTLVKGLS